eukprot:CAMPEP_0113304648 /NCGR_PEP_ID=MMETSP0010_2-20120614/4580_1 /TAXON_ID=216773 ORGANISM="Corethron hystrix, Strain 308" /NCGR_SAMPLE_ID=MMETSP0010_2 /ASSEMBLY_ACC=CAM_ASM_000155 /LENGTH=505 /DNA_ID=CAMNT_0000158887 /DNA_START=9 /DNA_END=1526 /DNA_ORIENTATION=- /assembly_acc=CAM_ASM_000155
MCKPPTATDPQEIIIAGAGPAGLLLAALLLKRNEDLAASSSSARPYRITLVDGRQNFGTVSSEDLKKHRSWMLGLANHGLDALRQIPELYDGYVKCIGVEIDALGIYLGSKLLEQTAEEGADVPETFVVDRNFVVAGMARYLQEKYASASDPAFAALYDTRVQYVDERRRRVLVRASVTGEEKYLSYDLLVGCDGVRSVVREALAKSSNFEMDIGDIFQEFKAVHVEKPPALSASAMSLLPAALPEMTGIALPETGNMVNISMGVPRHRRSKLPAELQSEDIPTVAAYVRKNFRAFDLVDYDDFARQWVGQEWNRTGQVHCSSYHSSPHRIVLMGDAAHATSPSIGMGMNTALRDAHVFYELLVKHGDELDKTLPDFSKERVREGQALTDLAYHLYCFDAKAQLLEVVHIIVRSKLHKMLPRLVEDHPQNMIGRTGVALADVYAQASGLGIIPKHRRINDETRRRYFETSVGMIKDTEGGTSRWLTLGVPIVAISLGLAKYCASI